MYGDIYKDTDHSPPYFIMSQGLTFQQVSAEQTEQTEHGSTPTSPSWKISLLIYITDTQLQKLFLCFPQVKKVCLTSQFFSKI